MADKHAVVVSKYPKGFPKTPRDDEAIGGGYFVFRRGRSTGRIRPSRFPFEHGDFESAKVEADRLAADNPGKTFDVLAVIHSTVAQATDDPAGTPADRRASAADTAYQFRREQENA